jgi:5-methylcytosine-specific restriction endonuclease McrA
VYFRGHVCPRLSAQVPEVLTVGEAAARRRWFRRGTQASTPPGKRSPESSWKSRKVLEHGRSTALKRASEMPFRYLCPGCHRIGDTPGRCTGCRRERDRQRPWKQRRKIRSGWEWGRLRTLVHQRDKTCMICGGMDRLQVHHRIPLADGGSNQLSNLELRCETHHRHATFFGYRDGHPASRRTGEKPH